MKYREYTDKDVINAAKEVTSLAGLLRKLNLVVAGGNYIHAKKTLQRLNIDTSHWKGQGWNKGNQQKDWSKYTRAVHLKKHLIKLRGHKCERCNISKWFDSLIVLELEHIDGDRTNNELDNLKLLCPNCHSQTSTWRRRKSCFQEKEIKKKDKKELEIDTKKKKYCIDCKKEILLKSTRCKSCSGKLINPTKIDWPPIEELLEMLKNSNYTQVAKALGVSDNAIRKHIKIMGP